MDHTGQPDSQSNGFVEPSYEFSSNFDRVHASQDADDGMSGETVPVEEAEAMDSSAGDADIDAEAVVRIVNGIGSFGAIEFSSLTANDVLTTEFTSLQVAHDYYNEYGRIKEFSVRRSKVGRRTKQGAEGEIIWQIFVCSREGERDGKHMQQEDRKMDPRPITRCGCEARIKVHVDNASGRWFVEQFCDNHNHPMLDARFRGLSQSHRVVKEGDLHQINSMRKSGLRVPTIFRAFANQSGGFETVGFEIKDIYNAIEKQRRAGATDAEAKYSLNVDKRLENLFWCDGTSRYDYNVFGDVLGFDATYSRNKYKCPLVIFSRVDHHMRTAVFGCAILSKESEGSYVWLLRSFLEVMKGKQPKSVITDGDLAMKSAVSIVFPGAHHRLCSWHLLRNATARVGRPGFLWKFRLCLMGHLEVDEFERIWTDSVADHRLEDHPWIVDMYAKKHSWSNGHIWGKFFTGLKTTSRCEALNMQLGKFIHNGYNLREFVEHFQHYLEFMRRRELVADYKSAYGEPAVKTKLEAIEQFAATVYTKEVFELFWEVLILASNVRVVSTKRTSACVLFEVTMYCKQRSWAVSWAEEDVEFSCSCQRMESFGLPYVHMVGVLVYLNMTAIPRSLILERWTKRAK
ncbi:protein FAR1-RELATED SEQUENCE 5-like [Arachis ipaensis]|uniref:protein FAR1-RELATED SEQUENCE 5-like n=1 Tax=Arachis ipaensis TaxID=130454 RepID=UPI0007AFDD7A|nr:protein FAR1-RELATED SEQUENCE 5-like [Arachis ipaensis]XP_025639519.1 protein FAR1-RELATED SEQUENCE 5-like [Arachis hypogaea]